MKKNCFYHIEKICDFTQIEWIAIDKSKKRNFAL